MADAPKAQWWTLLAVTLLACGGPAVMSGGYAAHDPPAHPTYVLVSAASWLAAAPVPEAATAHDPLGDPKVGHRMRLLGSRGPWLAVQSDDFAGESGRQHCAEPLAALWGLRLRLWVRQADALPVLGEAQRTRFADGTGYAIPPGLPLGPAVSHEADGAVWRGAQAGEYLTTLRLTPRAVGQAYVAAPLPAEASAESDAGELIAAGTRLALGGGELLIVGKDYGRYAEQVAPIPGDPTHLIAQLRGDCATFWVRVPANAVAKSEGGLGLLGALGKATQQLAWRPGVRLFWPDGQPAGETTEAVPLPRELAGSDGLRCFAWPLRTWWPKGRQPAASIGPGLHELPLCSEATDVAAISGAAR